VTIYGQSFNTPLPYQKLIAARMPVIRTSPAENVTSSLKYDSTPVSTKVLLAVNRVNTHKFTFPLNLGQFLVLW
jgi:hypothetical protein